MVPSCSLCEWDITFPAPHGPSPPLLGGDFFSRAQGRLNVWSPPAQDPAGHPRAAYWEQALVARR